MRTRGPPDRGAGGPAGFSYYYEWRYNFHTRNKPGGLEGGVRFPGRSDPGHFEAPADETSRRDVESE